MNESVLSTQNLITGYQDKGEVPKVVGQYGELHLRRGEFNVLIGINGVGKSTLLKTLSGEIVPLEGQVSINNQILGDLNNTQRSLLISFVFSNTSIVGKLTVFETVLMGRYPYVNWWGKLKDSDHTIALDALKDVGADHLQDRYINTLSDGERQKVMIARAIAQNTDVIFLDEPSAHLDLINRIEIFQLLKNIARKKKKAILLSTHEIEMSLQVADNLWILYGNQVKIGSPSAIVASNFINQTFSSPSIAFNAKSGVFNFCAPESLFSFTISHSDTVRQYDGTIDPVVYLEWECKKMISEGAYTDENPQFEVLLTLSDDKKALIWNVNYNGKKYTYDLCNCNLFSELMKLYQAD
ncbi:ABC transporter ATP-binding protein [Flammeovirga sp. EKP202]|uniref:ABC transporter ATP-binding protein n=1 Tax=Flammeovirga sp. EKP202 TaxID=2770592 RepID=UPI00165F0F7C|nr:ABC transporter ATP-binding protein [Flammeovirga sp. EKP202]MBD0401207.1 ABC transporter ATP-binding protein [Flammeovirga sp. EKP202]